jgi:hypothetical protein
VATDLVRTAVVAAGLLVLAACGGDSGEGRSAPVTTTGATTTEVRRTSTSTTAAPSTTTTCPPTTGDAPLASVDLDGDGVDELWRQVGSGASTDIVELRRITGCEEVVVTLDGLPAQFAVGGSVLLLQGLRCAAGQVVHLGATSDDGERYATLDLLYELRDGELVRVGDESGELTQSDPALADYSSFEC